MPNALRLLALWIEMHPSPSISPAAYWGDSFSGLFVGTRSNGDDPVTEVRGTEGCCWNTVPDSIEAERGQVPENRAPEASDRLIWGRRHAENVGDILDEAIARSKLANDPAHLRSEEHTSELQSLRHLV